jgi:RAT1-interacting protein
MTQEIACFSYDDKHNFFPDDRSLRYYYPSKLGADLSKGFETFEEFDDTKDEHLDSLLKAIMDLEYRTGVTCDADIITWRGMITKVSSSGRRRNPSLL